MAEYAALWHEAHGCGAKIFFADEAHFRADAKLRGKWVLRGEPALVDSSSPRYGEKASYYSAVCLETGEVEWMELDGNSNSGTSAAFLEQLREGHTGPLTVIWDNAPAHRGEAVREFLQTPGLGLQLVNLPGYSPDFNADEAVWGWAREEATGNLCLGTKVLVQERVGNFLQGLSSRKDEVKRRCRTVLQSRAETLRRDIQTPFPAYDKCTSHLGFGLAARRRACAQSQVGSRRSARAGFIDPTVLPAKPGFSRPYRPPGESRGQGMPREPHRFPVRVHGFPPPPERRRVVLRTLHKRCSPPGPWQRLKRPVQ